MKKGMRTGALVATAALLLGACGESGPSRSDALAAIADDLLIPGYETASESVSQVTTAVENLCSGGGNEEIAALNDQVVNARLDWARTEAMWVGPVMNDRGWALVDYPIDPEGIDELIADGELTLDVDTVSRRVAAGERGLGAIEHIISNGQVPSERECEYMGSVSEVASGEIDKVIAAWTEGPEPYRAMFVDQTDESINLYVNDSFDLLRSLSNLNPDEEGPNGDGVEIAQARLDSLRVALLGNETSPALSEFLDDDLQMRLQSAFDEASTALSDIPGSLSSASEAAPESITAAEDAIEEIRRIETTEVVSELGVTVGFSDSDGDSAG